jgi:uncharacterized membrane protein
MSQENNEYKSAKKFKFNNRFWAILVVSYSLFVLLVVLPFLLGYVDSTILSLGLTGLGWSLIAMVIVHILNRRPELRMRVAYVGGGAWLGLAVGFVGGMLLFGRQIIAAIGSLGLFVLVLIALPLVGGLIGFLVVQKKEIHYKIKGDHESE